MPTRISITKEISEVLKSSHGMGAQAAQYAIVELLPGLDPKLYFRAKMKLRGSLSDHITVNLDKDGLNEALDEQVERLMEKGIKSVSKSELLRIGLWMFCDEVMGVQG